MDFTTDPAEMSADVRFLELAAILARGYSRLRKSGFPPVIEPDASESRLDSQPDPRPSLDTGLTPEREVAG